MIDVKTRRQQRWRNRIQGLLLLLGMMVVTGVLAWMFLGVNGLLLVVGLSLVLALVRPRVSPSWVLRMYGARPLSDKDAPQLHEALSILANRAGLARTPDLYYIPTSLTNAFATASGKESAVAVTDGILRRLTGRQLVGVLAHEVSHLRTGDTRIMHLSDAMARFSQGLSYAGMWIIPLTLPLTLSGDLRPLIAGAMLILLPTLVTLMQLGLSRSREYDADLEGAALTGDPEGLATALEELERAAGDTWERLMVPRSKVPDVALLRSHPPTEERTKRLRQLDPDPDRAALGTDRSMALEDRSSVTAPARLRWPGIRW